MLRKLYIYVKGALCIQPMSDVKIVIDGYEIKGRDGMTILEAAEQKGIEIPTHTCDEIYQNAFYAADA